MTSGGGPIVRNPTDPLARTTPRTEPDGSGTGAQGADASGAHIIDEYIGPRGALRTQRPWLGRRAIDAIKKFFGWGAAQEPTPQIVFEPPQRFSRASTVPMSLDVILAIQPPDQRSEKVAPSEIVEAVRSPANQHPSIEEVRRTLLSVFDRTYHQYAVNRADADAKIAAMNLMRGMISLASSDQRFGSFISISEVGVGLDETGAVDRFVLRFYKGPAPAADAEVDPNKLITLIGMPDENDPQRMLWFVFDNGEFFQMSDKSRALNGIVSDVLKDLFLRGTFFGFYSGTVLKKNNGGQNGPGGAAPTSSGTPGAVPPAPANPPPAGMAQMSMNLGMQTQWLGALNIFQGAMRMNLLPLCNPLIMR